jgi:hypothetical protein
MFIHDFGTAKKLSQKSQKKGMFKKNLTSRNWLIILKAGSNWLNIDTYIHIYIHIWKHIGNPAEHIVEKKNRENINSSLNQCGA